MNRSSTRFATAVCAGVLAVSSLSACTGGGNDSDARLPGSTGNQVDGSGVIATRWWSTPVATAGSPIDYDAPTTDAKRLHVSRVDYCTVLRQTVHAGRSILSGSSADDPAVLVSTRAFVAETSALAPPAVAASWRVLGSTLVKVAAAGNDLSKVRGVDSRATARAAAGIAHDATAHCHLNLSTPTG